VAKKLGILVIHGMGSQEKGFAKPMIKELNRLVDDQGRDSSQIAWESVYWANILEPRQRKYFNSAKRSSDLDYTGLRKFMITAFGDASAYQKVDSTHNSTYAQIHQRLDQAIERLYVSGLNSRPRPMLVLAHSLGGHIISNYTWDMQKGSHTAPSPFQRMEKLAGIVTFGCNIPFFTFAYQDVKPIRFPPAQLPPNLKSKARWFNYYDPDDILGYPLRPLSPEYRKVVSKDIPINVGSFLSSWNPGCHSGYWTDNDFTEPVAKFITTFLN
jgi:hypothetical protein